MTASGKDAHLQCSSKRHCPSGTVTYSITATFSKQSLNYESETTGLNSEWDLDEMYVRKHTKVPNLLRAWQGKFNMWHLSLTMSKKFTTINSLHAKGLYVGFLLIPDFCSRFWILHLWWATRQFFKILWIQTIIFHDFTSYLVTFSP